MSSVCRAAASRWAQAPLRVLATALMLAVAAAPAAAQTTRIKDIADFEGIRDNMLVGYGLAVGLNGTGDTLNRSVFTLESLTGMLERLRLLNGTLEAGRRDGQWVVTAEVPRPRPETMAP